MQALNPDAQAIMDYVNLYNELVLQLLKRKLKRSDGIIVSEIKKQERKMGFCLPKAVRDYYQVAGRLNELNKFHNRLFDIDEIEIDGDYILFMEENQAVVHWGIKKADTKPDPEVWQRVNSPMAEWYSEELTFSQFMIRMYKWQVTDSPNLVSGSDG
jgi:hypothetical protein